MSVTTSDLRALRQGFDAVAARSCSLPGYCYVEPRYLDYEREAVFVELDVTSSESVRGAMADAANLVLWLASDEAGYASGQLWILDGGLTAQAQQMRL